MDIIQMGKRVVDEAWTMHFNNKPTNYKLKDGDKVVLLAQTIGSGSITNVSVPAGVNGVVKIARTARTYRMPGVTSCYFANVDVIVDGKTFRVRVPHGALRIVQDKNIIFQSLLMRNWRITGTKHGKLIQVIVQAKDRDDAVLAGSKGTHCLVVRDCILVTI